MNLGIAGWYTIHTQEQGLIGISMTNTSPALCPTRSKQPSLGTNPISVAAPANNGDSFVLGMTTLSQQPTYCFYYSYCHHWRTDAVRLMMLFDLLSGQNVIISFK